MAEEKGKKDYKSYTETRFTFDVKRRVVWQEINRYLGRLINGKECVVELGSGYCDWINSVKGGKRIAVDKFIEPKKFCEEGVECIFDDFTCIKKLKNESVDVFLASNFLEHLTIDECKVCLGLVKDKLKKGGKFVIIQPNYRFSYKEYFDDHTHLSIWSHESLKDFINAQGLHVVKIWPRFLPLTMKSKVPKARMLVRAYLNSPIKPMAKQMMLIALKTKI